MNLTTLQPRDIQVFSDAAMAFFGQTTDRRAAVRTAYLMDPKDLVVWDDFQGLIELSGRYRGSVSFSASRGLLSHVLLLLGEGDYSDASHRDIVGEIANQMSGYARRHFGPVLGISPPRILVGPDDVSGLGAGPAPVAIPLTWERYEAHLVVRMAES